MEAAVNLSASGNDVQSLTKMATGTVKIHSEDITTSVNVDSLAANLKTAQGMDLVGVGASLFSSPLGQVTGQAAGTVGGSAPPEKNAIRKLVLDWNIKQGIAEAKDVAFATEKTTVAFKGDVNLVEKKYQNFFVATVDPKGCAKNKVEVGGSLDKPRPVAASLGKQIAQSYLGQAGGAIGSEGSKIAGLFGGKKEESKPQGNPPAKDASSGCDQFYSGTVIQS